MSKPFGFFDLDALQAEIGRGNAERGFHEEGDYFRKSQQDYFVNVEVLQSSAGQTLPTEVLEDGKLRVDASLRNYYMTKLALIGTEVSEAVEELRAGRAIDERYHSGSDDPRKPEGVPSELADVVIRCFDLADEAGFSLGEAILEKLTFNATRGLRHGNKGV